MQIVLLSGGSGKRLWPLSNSARSKQFLPLLERKEGVMESMVQRVVRQVREANLTDEITIATNANQLDIITNQLGDSVTVVTEPERRDTFPAIALATSYLKYSKGCSNEEVVVIMPCDPYTEAGYFQTIGKMVECVETNIADLVLMGITPSYPSTKYGYVVPDSSETRKDVLKVLKFTEKPSVELAEELLKYRALWNGGVFAFRLGYIMNIVHKYIQTDSFSVIRNQYNVFPKISFDYEVAEKAHSVAVVPFTGNWKDLGTWNTLTDELSCPIIGNAVLGTHCKNTHVINELQIPIYVDGLKDVVVAACADGILVCEKEYSEGIKDAVENLSSRPMYEERRWGTYRVLDDSIYDDGCCSLTRSIIINPGKYTSYHIHHHRTETWTFVAGEGVCVINGNEQYVKAGDTVIIPKDHYHAVKAITKLTLIEVQSGRSLIAEDIEKIEWNWSK